MHSEGEILESVDAVFILFFLPPRPVQGLDRRLRNTGFLNFDLLSTSAVRVLPI